MGHTAAGKKSVAEIKVPRKKAAPRKKASTRAPRRRAAPIRRAAPKRKVVRRKPGPKVGRRITGTPSQLAAVGLTAEEFANLPFPATQRRRIGHRYKDRNKAKHCITQSRTGPYFIDEAYHCVDFPTYKKKPLLLR